MNKGTVLAHGCFDLLHPGHLEHLQQARAMGERLVVSITADRYINKGPGRPAFPEHARAVFLAGLRCVDEVYICHDESALPAIRRYKPEVYVKGPDYQQVEDGKLALEQAEVEKFGGRVAFTDGETNSSTALINQYLHPVDSAFQSLRDMLSLTQVREWLDRAGEVEAAVLGESIQDVYHFVRPAFKSAKENTIDVIRERTETYEGGATIVANHAAQFCRNAPLVSRQSWSIGKTRWIDQTFGQKMFSEVTPVAVAPVHLPDIPVYIGDAGLVIIADFGHGMFPTANTQAVTDALDGRVIALTVQSNGTNWGFNLYDKWHRADYLVVDHMELRLAHHCQEGDIVPLVKDAQKQVKARYVAVTLGHNGCMVYDAPSDNLVHLPVLTDRVVDRMGAGDAFLGATASLAYVGAPAEIIALVGNAAGAVKVGIQGNSRAITRRDVEKVIKGVLT